MHSNPCFEIWLLLHVRDVDANDQLTKCDEAVQRLRDTLGEYSGRTINSAVLIGHRCCRR